MSIDLSGRDTKRLCKGIDSEKRGAWEILHITHDADPRKRDENYLDRMREALGEQRFRREILVDWSVSAGDTYFADVAADPDAYRYDLPALLDAPIIVGMDFGRRFPAAVWLQYDPGHDRVFLLREWMPSDIDAHTFRDVVLWLSGIKVFHTMGPEGQMWVDRITSDPEFPAAPFFVSPPGRPHRFLWWAGHEALMERAEVSAESEERSTADIWAAAGVQMGAYSVSIKARELTIRKLLTKRADGWPGLLFSRHCRILFEGFRGGIVYAKGTKMNPFPDKAARDGYYEHLLDALGYAVVNLSSYRTSGTEPTPEMPEPAAVPTRGSFERYEQKKPQQGFTVSSPWEAFKRRYRG
jgi:hypothetical protein